MLPLNGRKRRASRIVSIVSRTGRAHDTLRRYMQARPSTAAAGASPASRASSARRIAVVFAVLLSWITFLDRAALGQAAPVIMRELRLSTIQMGYVFSAFGLAYAVFEIPGGI